MTRNDALIEIEAPFYLTDLEHLRGRYRDMHRAFAARFSRLVIAYSYKTNYLPSVLRTLHDLGAFAEVVSELEYALAIRLGVSPERIVFNGPIKSEAALARALTGGSLVNIDSLEEAARIADLAGGIASIDPRIGLRINLRHPEAEDHRARSRFGLSPEDVGAAVELLGAVDLAPCGLHAHLATKQRSTEHFRELVRALAETAKGIGVDQLDTLDVGGGFGHSPPDQGGRAYPSFDEYAETIRDTLAESDPRLLEKRLIIEPGMAMVNDAVRFITTVEATKRVGNRRLAFLGGSIHTVKPTRHAMNLPVRVFDRAGNAKTGREVSHDLVGYTCMDDDYIAVDQRLPKLVPGDRIEIAHVGAYTMVFKPPFIRAMPAAWSIDGDRISLDARAQDFADFFACLELDEQAS